MIIAYTGLPGGGKSLSAIQDYLLPQLKARRHVFCNIVGLNLMLVAARLDISAGELNRYLHRFTMSFDPSSESSKAPARSINKDSSVHYANDGGIIALIKDVMKHNEAVVILDECHEYLNSENWKVLRPFAKYVSMARHYGHDLVLITQHISDIWEPLQKRIHQTHVFGRGKLGFKTQYMETVYQGWNVLKSPGYSKSRMNDKSLYKLYSSHDGGAKEHLGYISIWRNSGFRLAVAFVVFGLVYVFHYFGSHGGFAFQKSTSALAAPASAPEYNSGRNVVYVKYVVCGAFDCKATRPDGSVLTLPLDYASGKYPLEVRKYVPNGSNSLVPAGFPGAVPAKP